MVFVCILLVHDDPGLGEMRGFKALSCRKTQTVQRTPHSKFTTAARIFAKAMFAVVIFKT